MSELTIHTIKLNSTLDGALVTGMKNDSATESEIWFKSPADRDAAFKTVVKNWAESVDCVVEYDDNADPFVAYLMPSFEAEIKEVYLVIRKSSVSI